MLPCYGSHLYSIESHRLFCLTALLKVYTRFIHKCNKVLCSHIKIIRAKACHFAWTSMKGKLCIGLDVNRDADRLFSSGMSGSLFSFY